MCNYRGRFSIRICYNDVYHTHIRVQSLANYALHNVFLRVFRCACQSFSDDFNENDDNECSDGNFLIYLNDITLMVSLFRKIHFQHLISKHWHPRKPEIYVTVYSFTSKGKKFLGNQVRLNVFLLRAECILFLEKSRLRKMLTDGFQRRRVNIPPRSKENSVAFFPVSDITTFFIYICAVYTSENGLLKTGST